MPLLEKCPGWLRALAVLALAVLALPVLALPSWAHAQPRVAALDWWVEPGEQVTLAEVRRVADWQPFAGWKSFGFGPEAVWVRVQLRAALPGEPDRWVLKISPAFLDQLDLYDPALDRPQRLGDFFPATDDALNSLFFSFEVAALPEARTLYVRLVSTSTRTLNVQLEPYKAAQRQAKLFELIYSVAGTLSLLFALWALLHWSASREALMGVFALKQLMSTVWLFFQLGFARMALGDWLPVGVLSAISSAAGPMLVAMVLWFMASLFKAYEPRRWMHRGLYGLALLAVAMLVLQAMGLTRESLRALNAILPMALCWLLLTLAFSRQSRPDALVGKNWLMAYLFFYALIHAVPSLIYLGVWTAGPLVLFANLSHLVVDGLVLVWIMQARAKRLAARQLAGERQLIVSAEQARLNALHLDDQRRLLLMLAHEIKTPLASLRLWMNAGPQGQQAMGRSIDDMSALIERCVQAGQLSDPSLQPRPQLVDAAALTQDVLAQSRRPSRVQLQLPEQAAQLHTDAQMLFIVLGNVLDNAYKYSPADSPVKLTLRSAPNAQGAAAWCWSVDSTAGVAGLPDPDKVFDKYYRSPQAQRQSGSGLGLYLARSLLGLLGGHISCSAAGQQVCFEVWLPAGALDRRE